MTNVHARSAGWVNTVSATGIPNGKLGMWVFLASEVMFFTGLIGAYLVLRLGHPHWPGPEGHLSVPLGTTNTLLLIGSSVTIVLALSASQRGAIARARWWLLSTALLGSGFLVIKGFEYAAKFAHHIVPSTNVFWSCYYVLTAFHGLHVLGGIVFNLWILSRTFNRSVWQAQAHRLELAGLYWHFVDIVWIFLFPLLYLI
ncbi:MAG: heme-copper oxidase subunit III [Candidatus Omnitrophica bacterium]|nr:heme-copper oxidase subunit III [Candidatus Omnitrophota bacterium]